MINSRQEAVSVKVPCRFKDGSFSVWGGSATDLHGLLLLDLGGTKLSVGPDAIAVHLRNRMVEAKRKACKKLRIVLELPVKDIRIGAIGNV